MLKTGITFRIEGFTGELVKCRERLMRYYDNGEYEFADDIDHMIVDATEDDEFMYIDAMLGQIEDDTNRVYTLA